MLENFYWQGLVAGAGTGAIWATVGWFGSDKEFDAKRFFRTVLIQTACGGIAGLFAQDLEAAIIAGMSGEAIVKSIIKKGLK